MANDSPVTVVPQLQFLSEKPIRRTSTSTSTSTKSSSSTSSTTRVNANSALRGTTVIDSTAAPPTDIEDNKAVAEDKAVANIGTSAEADPLSHAIRVLLYRFVFPLLSVFTSCGFTNYHLPPRRTSLCSACCLFPQLTTRKLFFVLSCFIVLYCTVVSWI